MAFPGKMCLKIILKVTKNQRFTLSSEDTFFEKPQGRGQIDQPPAVLGLKYLQQMYVYIVYYKFFTSCKAVTSR